MIKKYIDFIKESDDFNSLGEWIESLYDDEYVKNIVNRYIKDIDGDIRLSNAINTLDIVEKKDIKNQIETIVEKLTKMKSRGIPKDKSGKFQFLLKMLKNNKWLDGNDLTSEQKKNIKAEIKKMRQSDESWSNWGKRSLGLDDEQEDEDI